MGALDSTFGVLFIGTVVSAALYGGTCVQTWYYFARYPSDLWYIKLLVYAIFVTDSIHQALLTYTVFTYLVTDFGDFINLGKMIPSVFVALLFNAFTTAMVQCFLSMRIYKLSNKTYVVATGGVLSLAMAGFVSAIVCAVKGLQLTEFTQLHDLKTVSLLINAFAVAADLSIAVFLCTLLHKARSGFKRTDTIIRKLIVFSINTGLITSICALLSLISLLAWPTTFIFIGFYFCIGRLYCATMLATLNARNDFRDGGGGSGGGGESNNENVISLKGMQKSITTGTGTGTNLSSQKQGEISIKIDTEREYIRDEESSVQAV